MLLRDNRVTRHYIPFIILVAAISTTISGVPASGTAPTEAEVSTTGVLSAGSDDFLPQDEFAIFVTQFIEKYPDLVVDAAWRQTYGWVSIKPRGMEQMQRDILDINVKFVLEPAQNDRITFENHSSVELPVFDAIRVLYKGPMAARYNPETNKVEVRIWADLSIEQQDAIVRLLSNAKLPVATDTIEFSSADQAPMATAGNTYGGMAYGGCTGGFIGTRQSTSYGIITAAHCTSAPQTYDGDTVGATFTSSGNNDLRFTTLSGGTPTNQIKVAGVPRQITTTSGVFGGLELSKYGITTGLQTNTVVGPQGCMTFGNFPGTWCGLWLASGNVSEYGDSGGPWFSGNTAYGITSAKLAGGGGTLFTLINGIANMQFVALKTTP